MNLTMAERIAGRFSPWRKGYLAVGGQIYAMAERFTSCQEGLHHTFEGPTPNVRSPLSRLNVKDGGASDGGAGSDGSDAMARVMVTESY
jgi:hypothetical protein